MNNQFLNSQPGTVGSALNPASMPDFIPGAKKDNPDLSKYSVRYLKIDMDDLGGRTDLEVLETKAVRNEGVYILNREKFTFMDKFFMVIQYLELDRGTLNILRKPDET